MTNFEKPRESGDATPSDPGFEPRAQPAAGASAASPTPPGPRADPATSGSTDSGAAADRPVPAGFDDRGRVKRGRVSTLWVSLIAAAVFLILLIVFIAQNQKKASIHFLGFAGQMATGLVVLIAAIVGVLLAAIPGTIRIAQLRKSLKHNTPKDERKR